MNSWALGKWITAMNLTVIFGARKAIIIMIHNCKASLLYKKDKGYKLQYSTQGNIVYLWYY